jgi:hypothetical protein
MMIVWMCCRCRCSFGELFLVFSFFANRRSNSHKLVDSLAVNIFHYPKVRYGHLVLSRKLRNEDQLPNETKSQKIQRNFHLCLFGS